MLVSKLASLHSNALHPKLTVMGALWHQALIKTALEINYLKVAHLLSLEEDMITFNDSFPFSKYIFFLQIL